MTDNVVPLFPPADVPEWWEEARAVFWPLVELHRAPSVTLPGASPPTSKRSWRKVEALLRCDCGCDGPRAGIRAAELRAVLHPEPAERGLPE